MSGSVSEEAELYAESVRIESKVIYADLRVNARGQYLKLSETGSKRPRSTVLLPGSAVKWVYSLLDFYIRECAAGRQAVNKELAVDNKVFHFSVGSNERGRFLRISESGVSNTSGRHTLIIPCGGEDLTGWLVLRDCIRRVATFAEGEALEQPPELQLQQQEQPPPQQQQAPQPAAAGPSGSQPPQAPLPPPVPVLDVAGSLVVGPGHPPPTLTASPQGTPVLSCHGRRVFFDVSSTARGHYMRITEVAHQDRSTIVIPAVAVPKFCEAVDTCAALLEQRQQQLPPPQQQQQPPQQQQQQQQHAGPLPPQQWQQPPPRGDAERQHGS
ncbi:MAG: hypothetical protein J3K34DRAFT_525467 [Monoraphidium minutum]|nr:MAG: hypothetical protein J3K34DRAFT_525467 [Monoraphidium minutum]